MGIFRLIPTAIPVAPVAVAAPAAVAPMIEEAVSVAVEPVPQIIETIKEVEVIKYVDVVQYVDVPYEVTKEVIKYVDVVQYVDVPKEVTVFKDKIIEVPVERINYVDRIKVQYKVPMLYMLIIAVETVSLLGFAVLCLLKYKG